MATSSDRRIINLPLIASGNVSSSIVLPLDDPSDNLTKKINLGLVKDFVLSGFTGSTINSGNFTGGTVSGNTIFTSGLTATTLNINGINITGDTYVTGGTYSSGGTIVLNYNTGGESEPITGLTQDLTTQINALAETDEQTIELDLFSNVIRLKEIISPSTGGTRTFQGNVIIESGFTATTISANTINVVNLILNEQFTPSGSGDTTGYLGEIKYDDTYFYIKTNTGWGRLPLDYAF